MLRPTWHFVTPADIGWMLALTAPRLHAINNAYDRKLGIDERTFAKARSVIEAALDGGTHLTRSELADDMKRRRLTFERPAALARHVARRARRRDLQRATARQAVHLRAAGRARARSARTLSRDEALAELTRRYFQSHGPATIRDFSWWSGLTMKDAAAGIALSGTTPLKSPPALARARGATYLLPNYDEYLIAYRDRGAVLDPARARNYGVFTSLEYPHQAVIDGRVAGSWRRTIGPRCLSIAVKPYETLRPADVRAPDPRSGTIRPFPGASRDRTHGRLSVAPLTSAAR